MTSIQRLFYTVDGSRWILRKVQKHSVTLDKGQGAEILGLRYNIIDNIVIYILRITRSRTYFNNSSSLVIGTAKEYLSCPWILAGHLKINSECPGLFLSIHVRCPGADTNRTPNYVFAVRPVTLPDYSHTT